MNCLFASARAPPIAVDRYKPGRIKCVSGTARSRFDIGAAVCLSAAAPLCRKAETGIQFSVSVSAGAAGPRNSFRAIRKNSTPEQMALMPSEIGSAR